MKTKNRIFKAALEAVFAQLAHGSRIFARMAHWGLFVSQWGIKPTPQWFDHSIDHYWQWPKKKNSNWLERGFFNSLCLDGGSVLELTCGDGFYASHFYAAKAEKIIACDRDEKAIKAALKYNKLPNIEYVVADILTGMPQGEFNNVIWDFGFPWCAYFTAEQVDSIVLQIKSRLKAEGIFSGYLAIGEGGDAQSIQRNDEINFKSIDEVKKFLLQYFANVRVIETASPGRHNTYFYASDGIVPFKDGWAHIA